LEPRVRGHRVSPEHLGDAALIFVLFLVTMVALWLVFVAAGHAPLDSLFDVVSATGTVGLSTGVVGPDLALGLKLLLCAGMLLGRLEIVAFLVLLYPYTWWGKRRRSR
jgi:trk system potassium uptake protein TrkH